MVRRSIRGISYFIKAVVTLVSVEASAAFITEAGLMLLTDVDHIPVGVISAFYLSFPQ